MQTISRTTFTTVKTEGGLLPADLLQRIAEGDRALPGLRPEDYHRYGERLNEVINRAWNRCLGAWRAFGELRQRLPDHDSGTTLTRERWLLILFEELGFGRLPSVRGGLRITGATEEAVTYPISHLAQNTPIHLVSFRQDLDRRSELATTTKRSPYSLMQEFLNRSDDHQWGIIANGLLLRILRDNASLTRAAYVEFDLEAMLNGELYADFALLWLLCHQSRFEPFQPKSAAAADEPPRAADEEPDEAADDQGQPRVTTCWLEVWSKQAAEQGTRALDALRDGVQEAITALGRGFLTHPANRTLRTQLQQGELTTQAYYRQLLRLVYRLIFLFVAEDRDLLLLPTTPAATKSRYSEYYSLARLRRLAERLRGGPHADLYQGLRLLFRLLQRGYEPLGLPGLGSFLFSARATPALDELELANHELLTAVRALAFTLEGKARRPVDYRNLGSEELGSVYESLLELHPQVNVPAGLFTLTSGAGSERKTSGSHYTPPALVNCLLDSALEPVIAARLAACRGRQGRATTDALEAALLSIRVLDYAGGSGHLIIGAGRRLARHLAQVRSGEEEPTPAAIRQALRDVARHCLYAVDVNEMAVELCKVALWMETLEPGKPLSFLDKNIQCGNSLIGVTPGLDLSTIPDDAFQPVTGDDKATATALRRRNKREREGQLGLRFDRTDIATPADLLRWRETQLAQVTTLSEDDVAQLHAKEAAYADYLAAPEYAQSRLLYDLWTAAFFWPLPPGDADRLLAPTHQALVELRAGHPLDAELVRRVRELAARHQFFHWALAFPEVFTQGDRHGTPIFADPLSASSASSLFPAPGFDVVLSNPPWERIKLQEKEWFAVRSPAIANAPNAAARRRLIDRLATEDPALAAAFQTARAGAENESHFIRNSNAYPLCGRGDVNTYAVFAELARYLIADQGRAGVIVPTGIATDDTTKFYFQDIMETSSLVSLYDFENRRGIFPSVHRSYKFCLLTLRGVTSVSHNNSEGAQVSTDKSTLAAKKSFDVSQEKNRGTAEFVFFALDVADLRDEERRFTLSAEDITLLNPNTRTCPIFRSQRDAELTKAIYRRVPVLIKEGPPEENPWDVRFATMFHMSNDSHLFRTREQLENEGWQLTGNHFVRSDTEVCLPVYEAKMIHHFDHRWATYEGLETIDLSSQKKGNPYCLTLPRYWVNHNDVLNQLRSYKAGWFVAFRDIARSTDERTALFTIIPAVAVGNKAPILISKEHEKEAFHLAACAVSFVFDYVARQSIGGTTLNFFIVKQLAFIPPTVLNQPCSWENNSCLTLSNWLLSRVLELTYTAWDMEPFARDCGYTGPPFRWDEARRFLLRCELDAAYFHLYGIARDDVAYILDTFPIVKRKEIAAYGEYRTQRVILAIYDEMAAAMRTGVPYQTHLDPPPADIRVAHEDKDLKQ